MAIYLLNKLIEIIKRKYIMLLGNLDLYYNIFIIF